MVREERDKTIMKLFPVKERMIWEEITAIGDLTEIRLRVNCPVLLRMRGKEWFISAQGELTDSIGKARIWSETEMERFLAQICQYSVYAYEDELKQGYLTVAGGHRIGVVGKVVLGENGQIKTMKNISSVNIRIAHEIIGAADKIIERIYNGGRVMNTLILSPPGKGKTTLLRDLVRQVSDGNTYGAGQTVGLIDERAEIVGNANDTFCNRIGIRTDILSNCPKITGMMLLLRSMAPDVIAVDELGDDEELIWLEKAAAGGCSVLATAHGETVEDFLWRFDINSRRFNRTFRRVFVAEKEKNDYGWVEAKVPL